MAGLLSRLAGALRAPPATEKDAAYPLYFGGGSILSSWPTNWWQAGKDPVGASRSTAVVHACVDAYAQTIASIPGASLAL